MPKATVPVDSTENPDRISTHLDPESPPPAKIRALDSRGNPIVPGKTYLKNYTLRFELVTAESIRHGNTGVPYVITSRVWPVTSHPQYSAGNVSPRNLSPLDPVVLGRELRCLMDWFAEYRSSLL